MKKKLEQALKNLPEHFIVLTILPRDNFNEINLHMAKLLTKDDKKGTYVTINKPYNILVEIMKKNKISHDNLLFIDCTGNKSSDAENCVFLGSPDSLTNIGISLQSAYKDKENTFLILDSLDALSLYHTPDTLIKFSRSIINKLRETNMKGVMIGLHEDTNKKLIDELSIVCDKVISFV